MRIIFMGTPDFAVASLDILVKNNFNVVAVVTAPDKPSGRGLQVNTSAVKKYAVEKNLMLLQPHSLKSEEFVSELEQLKADLQIVVAFRMLPEIVWNMPPEGTYNLHASLLPKYRGAAPINWAVINGERQSGVTTFKLKHEIDTGNVLFQEKVNIGNEDTAGNLHDVLMTKGSELVLKTVEEIELKMGGKKELNFMSQDDAASSHAPKLFKDDCKINWNRTSQEVYNLVRGLSPYPTAFTQIKNGEEVLKTIKIFFATYLAEGQDRLAGTVVSDNKSFIDVYCGVGILRIAELQLEGKKRMHVSEFLKGYKIHPGAIMLS